MDLFSTLTQSDNANNFQKKLSAGSIYNKNVNVRNISLMRNIGKYPLYDMPMFPEIGMLYNVYEKLLCRPTRHYTYEYTGWTKDSGFAVNGLIEYNNGVTESLEGNGSERFKKFFDKNGFAKDIYVTNSGSLGIEGGNRAVGNVRSVVDNYLNFVYNTPYITEAKDGANLADAQNYHFTITNGDKNEPGIGDVIVYDEEGIEGGIGVTGKLFTDWEKVARGEASSEDRASSLIAKTNTLFNTGKIKSMINREFILEGDNKKISRGRALNSKDGESFCRVWTQQKQYSKFKDLIRPFTNDNTFINIQEKMKDGMRPNGKNRLADMGVMQKTGIVNMTPYKENGELNKESIKKCMFSIENLAWKGLAFDKKVREGGAQNTLSKEQQGPNGGRIMWFPPYNLKFTENISTRWNESEFIGRGEKIYTYTNTERSGTLGFTLLVDHPSIINAWIKGEDDSIPEDALLRYFAGCEIPDELNGDTSTNSSGTQVNIEGNVTPEEKGEQDEIRIYTFFPNNYSGVDEIKNKAYSNLTTYLCTGTISSKGIASNKGYEISLADSGTELNNPIKGKKITWHYNVDESERGQALRRYKENGKYYIIDNGKTVPREITGDTEEKIANNYDTKSYGLNTMSSHIDEVLALYGVGRNYDYGNKVFSFADLAKALDGNNAPITAIKAEILKNILSSNKEIESVTVNGRSTSFGDSKKNTGLAKNRALSTLEWIRSFKIGNDDTKYDIGEAKVVEMEKDNHDVSSPEAKIAMSSEIVIKFAPINKEPAVKAAGDVETSTMKAASTDIEEMADENNKKTLMDALTRASGQVSLSRDLSGIQDIADNEYLYFSKIAEDPENSFIKQEITEKVKYFTPAFHSITPEGFNARLTFLNQCSRQGPTIYGDGVANNSAFGKAPYCVLRIGDFYNTKIVINSISISYGDNQLDLNPDGIGVQPLLANVDINFNFIGGSDLSGPISRLQNAVSFNYYGNTSVYDARSDYRASSEYKDKEKTSSNVIYWDPSNNSQ